MELVYNAHLHLKPQSLILKIKSTKQFWWRLNHLKRNGGEITVTDRTSEMDVKEFNRVESLVRKRVRRELGSVLVSFCKTWCVL